MEGSAVQRLGSAAVVPVTSAMLFFLALAPTWLRAHGDTISALAIVAFFSKLCHQRAERTLYLLGAPTAVCLRCLGIYAGAALGGLLQLSRKTALRWLSAALIVNIVDVAAESIGLHGNLPLLRLLIGAALGIGAGALLAGSLECEVGACETRF
jgi:uncharacterized membrane protein